MVRGYCVGSRQADGLNKNLGSGMSQDQGSDLKIETKIETKLLPLACSSADLTQEQKDNNAADQRAVGMMLRSVCGVGGCGEFFDKPRCERLIRSGEHYSMQVVAQNYGKNYDLANCVQVMVCNLSCFFFSHHPPTAAQPFIHGLWSLEDFDG